MGELLKGMEMLLQMGRERIDCVGDLTRADGYFQVLTASTRDCRVFEEG